MKSLIRFILVGFSCSTLSFIAVAGTERDTSKEMAVTPAPEACNWTGFYLGLHAGGQFGHSEDRDLDGYNLVGQRWSYDESGFVGGMQLGYNWQWNWLVIGPEVDLGYMNLDGKGTQPSSPSGDTFGRTESDFYTTFRARVGVALDCWLFYVTGGGIGVNYTTQFIDPVSSNLGPDTIHASNEDFDWGYTVGGGIERAIGRHWSIKAEYLYYNLDRQSFSGVSMNRGTFNFNGEGDGHIIRAGLNYRF